jgi:hypothetical protein
MKATNVTQHSLDVPKAALAAENPILGTWKLRSLVFEAIATGQRSTPFGDHPDGYLSCSPDVVCMRSALWKTVQNHAT